MRRPLPLIFAAVLWLGAVSFCVYGAYTVPDPTFRGTLLERLPPAPPGWTRVERPIAETPEIQQAVDEQLNFDDGIFVDYTRGNQRLSVYAAYWTPGRMSRRLVASHTPDVCWVANGWKITASTTLTGLRDREGRVLPPAEARTFLAQGRPEHVWYWHVVGPTVYSYATNSGPPRYAIFVDLWEKGLKQREEQFFIRLSSPRPLDEMGADSPLPAVLGALPLP
jgi:hypothetical protein